MNTGRFLKIPGQTDTDMDKYTASIELSNACRKFYQSRLEAAEGIKSKWERHAHPTCCGEDCNGNSPASDDHTCRTGPTQRHRNSIDEAMERLRAEVSSLMDQDLSLMKQLLTLNETIEDLKWQRRYYYSPGSRPASSADLQHSDVSLSDTDMYVSEDDSLHTARATCPAAEAVSSSRQTPLVVLTPPASSSGSSTTRRKQDVVYGCGHVTTEHAQCSGSEKMMGELRVGETSGVKVFQSEQDSFDSGFHEASSEEEAAVFC